jgi:DNA-binding response OmpR family regulator
MTKKRENRFTMSRTLFLAVHEPLLRQTLADAARAEGFLVYETGEAKGDWGNPSELDVAIIDSALGGASLGGAGWLALRDHLRSQSEAALLLLVEAGQEIPEEENITKPIRLGFLLARLSALAAKREKEKASLRLGPYRFDAQARRLIRRDGGFVRLTEKETDILRLLLRAEGRLVRREELLERVWGYGEGVNTHTVETHVYRLRRKIEADPGHATLILTEEGGYRVASL